MTIASELREKRRELEEVKLDFDIIQGKYLALAREVMVLEAKRRQEKQAKCKHVFATRTEREFEGAGFVDYEYLYCTKCRTVKDRKAVNVVVQSEK